MLCVCVCVCTHALQTNFFIHNGLLCFVRFHSQCTSLVCLRSDSSSFTQTIPTCSATARIFVRSDGVMAFDCQYNAGVILWYP